VAHSDAPKPLGIRKKIGENNTSSSVDYANSEMVGNGTGARDQSQTMIGKKGGMR
jgi:hypothetical protein